MIGKAVLCAGAALLLCAQPAQLSKGRQWMEIVMERKGPDGWRAVESGLVLDRGDRIRFRFRMNFDGHLYVINSGTSGTKSLLFPKESTGTGNRIAAYTNYLVPATAAAFEVSGPPGHDVVYWLVSPVPLGDGAAQSMLREQPARPPVKMLPRCHESLSGVRSRCIDSSAGPRSVDDGALPEGLSSMSERTRRELVIVQERESSRLSSPEPLSGPVVYEFRVAHR